MRSHRFPLFLAAVVAGTSALVIACGSSHDAPGSGSASAVSVGGVSETCTATFHWLQKDAYKNTGGRTNKLWPPHTTTMIDVACVDADGNATYTTSAFKENHGTRPGQLDANGRAYLDETKTTTAKGTREQMDALLASYASCECDGTTQFLAMDAVNDDLRMQKILQGFADYASKHLTCTGDVTTPSLIAMLQSGDYEGAVAAYENCAWEPGSGFVEGLAESARGVVPDLSQYHVCNNDAKLEAALFAQFAADGTAPACDSTSPTCSGPAFFYDP